MKNMRQAIAMIELIFAIVIMGIVLMSAPMLISTASKSGYVAIQQEAINEASSQVNMILGHYWDESDTNQSEYSTILQTTAGDTNLRENNSTTMLTGRRFGTPNESYRSFLTSGGLRPDASTIGDDADDIVEDDMDDFDGTTGLKQIQVSPDVHNVETTTIDIARNVLYMSDTPGSGNYIDPGDNKLVFDANFSSTPAGTDTTNIKRIKVTLTSSSGVDELEKTIILHAFSCNIGSYKLEER